MHYHAIIDLLRHFQDVMVVMEPTMMGGEYGDEDERFITRLENAQFDPSVQMTMGSPAPPGQLPPPLGMHGLMPPGDRELTFIR